MLLDTKDGVRCDICNMIQRDNFIYYSYDCRLRYSIDNNHEYQELDSTPDTSLDVCDICYNAHAQYVVENYKPTVVKPTRHYPKGIYCDLSSVLLIGNYKFYHISITKVHVVFNHKQSKCSKCGKKRISETCECGSNNFDVPISSSTTPRILDINVAEEYYLKMTEAFKKQSGESSKWS